VKKTLEPPPPELVNLIHRDMARFHAEQQEWIEQYGHIRPCITTNFAGRRFVAAGERFCYSGERPWDFIPDFLMEYVPVLFGHEWWSNERAKPEEEQHPVVLWRTETAKHMNLQPKGPEGFRSTAATGFMAAYMTFAFNLFAIEDNSRFDDDLLRRLKNKEHFQGARHEVFAEATCLRAGFVIEHENEKDRSKRHAEFTARHKRTGQLFSVEAKSRHRQGILGQSGTPKPWNKLNIRFGDLLNDAIAKNPPHPLVVFIDTNLPYQAAERVLGRDPLDPYKPSRIMTALLDANRKFHGGVDKYALLVFTNHPHHYAAVDELDPQKHTLEIMPLSLPGVAHLLALHELRKAVFLYGKIPQEFPKS
jgi:hypothetical protein